MVRRQTSVIVSHGTRIFAFLLKVGVPALPIAATVIWLITVTLPYYAFGFNRLPEGALYGNATDPTFYYERVVSPWLGSLMLSVWAGFHFWLIPLVSLMCIATCLSIRKPKRWFIVSLICVVAMYIHLEHPLWPNGDVLWATDAIYDMRPPGQ